MFDQICVTIATYRSGSLNSVLYILSHHGLCYFRNAVVKGVGKATRDFNAVTFASKTEIRFVDFITDFVLKRYADVGSRMFSLKANLLAIRA